MEEDIQTPPTSTPSSDGPTPPVTTDDNKDTESNGSSTPPKVSPQEKAYREAQSRADRANHGRDELEEQVGLLSEIVGEQYREKLIGDFVKNNADKYPLVSADDLQEFAGSPEQLEAVATRLQKKYEEIKQDTLASVREVPSEEMSESEKAKEREKLRNSDDPDKFAKFLRFASKRK